MPRWIAMSSRCLRNAPALMSPVKVAILPPTSAQTEMAAGPHAPRVSIAIGAKMKSDSERAAYFMHLLFSAKTAADPAAIEEWLRCEGARVSGQVKSHTRYLPPFHGSRVAPSGLLPSPRRRRDGSSSAWTPRERIARTMTSLARADVAWRR